MTDRVDLATLRPCRMRSVALPPTLWRWAMLDAPRDVEVCACADDLLDADAGAMIAASRLRDAGLGVAARGVARAEHLAVLRRWPLSAAVLHPALTRAARSRDGARWIEALAASCQRYGMALIAAGIGREQAGQFRDLGCTHGAWLTAA